MYILDKCNWTPYGTNPELDKKVDNDYWWIRNEAAKQGYGLDILINDEDFDVRSEVACQGYGLDILINDKNERVRREVAEHGYGLDILVNDENYWVRQSVANQGYGLDKLINDKDYSVRGGAVTSYLRKHNLTLEQWIEQNPDKCALDQNKCSIEKVTKDFIYKINESNKLEVQSQYNSVDEFFSEPIANDIKLDTIVICSVDTKIPLIKLSKVKKDNDLKYLFIVDITNDHNDNFSVKSIIQTKEQLNKLIQQTIDSLNNYPQFIKYAEDLENCL